MFLNMIKFACFLAILSLLCEQSTANRRICGEALAQAMDLICIHGYNSKHNMKKSVAMDNYAYNEIDNDVPYPYGSLPFLAKIHADSASLLEKERKRRRDGIIEECCKQPCSLSVLESYC